MVGTEIQVGVIGFNPIERAVTDSLINTLADDRCDVTPYQLSDNCAADILLVDGADARALEACSAYQLHHPLPDHLIVVGPELKYASRARLVRPLNVNALRATLAASVDDIVASDGAHKADCEFPDTVVLVADGDQRGRAQSRDCLRGLVGAVHEASSGQEAHAIVVDQPVNVAILDARFQDPDTYTLAQQIVERSPNAAVVIVLSDDAANERARAKAVGCNTFLIRPLSEFVLRSVVAEYVDDLG